VFASLWATSITGLTTGISTAAVIADDTPPTPGLVWDGRDTSRDLDCDVVGNALAASWRGFSASAGLDHFDWGVGTAPGLDDVVPFFDVGIAAAAVSEVVFPLPSLAVYYSTVRAVSAAGVTAAASSDGVRFICGTTSAAASNATLAAACAAAGSQMTVNTVCIADGSASSAAASAEAQYLAALDTGA
jgi:hypothetical protein